MCDAEAITVESFNLLSEQDLINLGFKLGHRALIMSRRSRSVQVVEMSAPPELLPPSSTASPTIPSSPSSAVVMINY